MNPCFQFCTLGKKPAAVPTVKQELLKIYLGNTFRDGVPFTALESATLQSSSWQLLFYHCSLHGDVGKTASCASCFSSPKEKRGKRDDIKLPRLDCEGSFSRGRRNKVTKGTQEGNTAQLMSRNLTVLSWCNNKKLVVK